MADDDSLMTAEGFGERFQEDAPGIDPELADALRPLTDEEVEEHLQGLREAGELRRKQSERNGGRPRPPSWPLIRQAREERSKQLLSYFGDVDANSVRVDPVLRRTRHEDGSR